MEAKKLRIVFMGTPEFAVESLKALVENGYQVAGVVTAPDKPAGRGQKLAEPAVKKYAQAHRLPVLQPEKLRDPAFLTQLKELRPDLQVVVAFRMLPEVVWSLPPLGTFNLHASLLPQYRGAAPLNWAVINGEKETGVTTFLLDHQIDTGKIIFREKTPVGDRETAGDLHDRLMEIGAQVVLKTVDALAAGHVEPLPQESVLPENQTLKPAPKIFREDTHINWNAPAQKVYNLIRGLSPYPAAWTSLENKAGGQVADLKIYFAEYQPDNRVPEPGTLLSDGKTYLQIACADGWLRVTDLQLSAKKRMKTDEFLRGFQDINGWRIKK